MPYAKSETSLMGRLREFYKNNPDEFLTYGDIANKFDVSVPSARHAVQQLRRDGVLRSSTLVYKAPSAPAR